jgi:hypothetical protein
MNSYFIVDKMSFLPRDGLIWEKMFKLLRETALQPLLIGPLLCASMLDILQPLAPAHNKYSLIKALGVLLALGVLRTANNFFSKMVMNNWTVDMWKKGEELVLITGGGSGIGQLMARDLAQWSKAIIVLDLTAPKISMRKRPLRQL